jgi:tetratricopeptide (TPR) repeat protein
MRAMRLMLILVICLAARPVFAGVSDPNEIVEQSKLDSSLTMAKESYEKVSTSVKTWFNDGVAAMKTWAKKVTGEPAPAGTATEKRTTAAVAPQNIDNGVVTAPQVESPGAASTGATGTTGTTGSTTGTPAGTGSATASSPGAATGGIGPAQDLREVKKRLKKEGVSKVTKSGRKPQGNLMLTKAGVPLIPLVTQKTVKLAGGKTKVVMAPVKRIPRLDIGEEPTLSRNDFLPSSYMDRVTEVKDIPALPTPPFVADSEVKAVFKEQIVGALPPQDMEKKNFGLDKIITIETIAKAMPVLKALNNIVEKNYKELTPAQQLWLTAMILFDKGDRCAMLIGLLDELSQNERYTADANFHLGICAAKLQLHTLAFDRLAGLIRSENPVYASDAIKMLAKNLPSENEITFSKLIRDLKNQKLIPESLRDEVNYLTAKGAFKEGDYQQARAYAETVPEKSGRYGNSQFITGLAFFSLGQTGKGLGRLEQLREWMAKNKVNDKNLNSLTAINIARMRFTQGRYKEALPMYMAIDKDHPIWVQALVEQGWAQLATNDFAGAIGNMYSLHSPYFRAVYKPESFVVRTIGYLNICQYGDAYRTLSWLEQEYRPWVDQVNGFVTTNRLASDFYEMVISYLKTKSDSNTGGLPYQIIREMARQREFLNYQTSLNEKADEVGRYEGVNRGIADMKANTAARIAKATARYNEARANLKKAETAKTANTADAGGLRADDYKRLMKFERDTVVGLRFQNQLLDQSKKTWTSLNTKVMAKIDKDRYILREKAGRHLVTTLLRLKGEMNRVLENNEFLRYEVFSGSGENIRYQVAGGKVAEGGTGGRIPASIKPQKAMAWSFDGEYWEDEIGSYRSGLKNNCAQVAKMDEFFKDKEKGGKDQKGQAAVEKGAGQ